MLYRAFKRGFDFISASIMVIAISPLLLVLMVMVKFSIGSPIFFVQRRTGLHMKEFKIIKFRSMTNEVDETGKLLSDEKRITKVGKFLRATSLDELPELFSIIKGDMSVIGPRPLPPTYDRYYSEREKKRFDVRGGLVPPEVLYNNVQPTWEEQLEYEANYAENLSLRLDILIILTVFKGLFKRYNNDYGEYVRKSLIEERE